VTMRVSLVLNGRAVEAEVEPAESLLLTLRERLGLTGAKPGCEAGHCGACTVLLDGAPVRSCLVPSGRLEAAVVETVEGVAAGGVLTALQEALVAHGGLQCGYCTSGVVMRMTALLRAEPRPGAERVRDALASNFCRCTGYEKIVESVLAATGNETADPAQAGPVGFRAVQKQGRAKVTGAQRYTTDLVAPGMLHARILRSPHAHAVIRGIDVSRARALPGVVDVITFEDVPEQRYNSAFRNPNDTEALRADERVLNEKARYDGDRIAAVAAETRQAAVEAIQLIEVDYEPLPAYTDPLAALLPGAVEIHEGTGNEAAQRVRYDQGDAAAALEGAPVRVSGTFRVASVQHANLEPKAVLASFDEESRLTIRATTQVPFHVRTVIAHALGIDESAVRVVAPDLGGGQGERSDPADEYVAVVLARRTGRPVKLVNTREEQFTSSRVRHPAVIESELGLREDGTLVARRTRATLGTGGYATMGYRVMYSLGLRSAALYRVPNLSYEGRVAYTNAPVAGGMRGFGSPQAAFALETQLDQAAARLGLDPLELRARNVVRPGDPYLDLDERWSVRSAAAVEGLRIAGERCQWAEKRRSLREPQPDGQLRGIGVAVGTHISTVMPFYRDHGDVAAILHENGVVVLYVGVPDTGTGSTTVFAQIAATELGLPLAQVRVETGDSELAPYDQGAHSSRTTYVAGGAVRLAAANLKAEILSEAETMLEAAAADLELRDGKISVRGTPTTRVTLSELAHWLRYESDHPRRLTAEGSQLPESVAPPFAVCVAEVAVDPRTGGVKVERMLEAIDCGRPINPMFVEGQLHGAIHMGIGAALCEELVFAEDGRLLTRSFGEYQLLRAPDMPAIETVILDSEEPTGPFGAKGLGEASVVPVAAAVSNAVAHAIGAWPTELPLTPKRVLALLGEELR
jgi:putative selenate reductase molybdopterin-binding subunit